MKIDEKIIALMIVMDM